MHTLCENHLKKSTTAVAFLLSKEESVVVEESSTETVVFSGQQRVTQVWKENYFPSTLSPNEEFWKKWGL